MSTQAATNQRDILHIAAATTEEGQEVYRCYHEVQSALNLLAPYLEHRTDVYSGLAWLCLRSALSSARGSERAVIVCVDEFESPEWEFFSLVPRIRRCLPIYVYSNRGLDDRVARAIRSGAAERFTEEAAKEIVSLRGDRMKEDPSASHLQDNIEPLVNQLHPASTQLHPAESQVPPAARSEEKPSAPADTNRPAVVVQPDRSAPSPSSRPLDNADRSDAPQEEKTDSPSPAVRVPWLRYHDRPTRTGPKGKPREQTQTADAKEKETADLSSDRPATTEQPLLSEAELQALMGDDIASLAPRWTENQERGNDAGHGSPQS